MGNIWFLRTDKMTHIKDISTDNPFIYSQHGVCAEKEINKLQSVIEFKKQIFPKALISGRQIRNIVYEIKNELIKDRYITYEPKQCDYFIWCWISGMDIGDIVVVRNSKNEIFICEINDYVSEKFLDENGYFGRSVRIIKEWKKEAEATEIKEIIHRILGRRTLERNANNVVKKVIEKHIEGEVGNKRWK
ncbi:hypothetical protein DBB36_13615 [Flavobacterium sp. WLB]|uniref:hypothetical protein n=1 Tax=unclassified Flavobacterium TaxID=196869 RepID=UPI0006AB8C5C|nr:MULTISPECIES: hypothetical protein [unclassified Flavobacterium]KOP37710.1 hypothetical protein AKO67_13720 [Flavobacterium sp. VMW]OWU91194.1 hypothetical protein APR43_09585 [Flavobacterium sp. NLM]PUU69454.1 hypothetical protein DBB36_13615 [Flavobacterium sp. WLB]